MSAALHYYYCNRMKSNKKKSMFEEYRPKLMKGQVNN